MVSCPSGERIRTPVKIVPCIINSIVRRAVPLGCVGKSGEHLVLVSEHILNGGYANDVSERSNVED